MRLLVPITVVFLAALTSSCGPGAGTAVPTDISTGPPDCPTRLLAEGSLRAKNQVPGAFREIVPGHPDRLLLCRYRGQSHGQQPPRLSTSRYLSGGPAVEAIADRLNRLPPAMGAYACPATSGGAIYAIFGYEDEAEIVVEITLRGCPAVRNGRAHPRVLSPRLANRLKRLVPLPTQHVRDPSEIRGAIGPQSSESMIDASNRSTA